MKIPVVVAAAAQAALLTGAEIGSAVCGYRVEIIGAHILTPLPDVARHVVQTKLIGRLQRDVVCLSCPTTSRPAAGQPPAETRPEHPHNRLACRRPPRPVPGNLIGIVASTKREFVAPRRSAARRVLPFRL